MANSNIKKALELLLSIWTLDVINVICLIQQKNQIEKVKTVRNEILRKNVSGCNTHEKIVTIMKIYNFDDDAAKEMMIMMMIILRILIMMTKILLILIMTVVIFITTSGCWVLMVSNEACTALILKANGTIWDFLCKPF